MRCLRLMWFWLPSTNSTRTPRRRASVTRSFWRIHTRRLKWPGAVITPSARSSAFEGGGGGGGSGKSCSAPPFGQAGRPCKRKKAPATTVRMAANADRHRMSRPGRRCSPPASSSLGLANRALWVLKVALIEQIKYFHTRLFMPARRRQSLLPGWTCHDPNPRRRGSLAGPSSGTPAREAPCRRRLSCRARQGAPPRKM